MTTEAKQSAEESDWSTWPHLYDTGLLSERHQILHFQGGFSTKNYDHVTKLIQISKYENF